MPRTLFVVIGCDTDPDRPAFVTEASDTSRLVWKGMLDGIPRAKDALRSVTDSESHEPVFTWCLRVDEQVEAYHGDVAWVLREHANFLNELEGTGDELAWHPHFWRFDEPGSFWFQEVLDTEWQGNLLQRAHAAYREVLSGRALSVRMGWDFHNNRSLQALDALGVLIDFSAIPGVKIDPQGDRATSFNAYDWLISPTHAYRPSKTDYRRPAMEGEQALGVIEAPISVSESFFWGMFRGAVMTKKMRNATQFFRALRHPTYFVGITGKPTLFAPLISQLRRSLDRGRDGLFVTYFHPDELLDNPHRVYSLENMVANVRRLVEWSESNDVRTRFIRAQDIPEVMSV